ncbi:MAG TPA: glycoside hydrolase family 2 TIM barrel-domain containing protein [Planctomycetota bacterium]|jgi:beta-mannosidase
MKKTHNLSELQWQLTGFIPFQWQFGDILRSGRPLHGDVPTVPARVPGSVQAALRDAGLLPDWNIGLSSRACEWVEHRHWMFHAPLPSAWLTKGHTCRLRCLGLDSSGWVLVNGTQIGRFENSFLPHVFDLTPALTDSENTLQIIFDCPPRWLGQFGYTSQMTEWKPRFNYTWDWTCRLVQIGIWDAISLQVTDGVEIQNASCVTTGDGLRVAAQGGRMQLTLCDGEKILRSEQFTNEIVWKDLPVRRWWPAGHGKQPLYTVTCTLLEGSGDTHAWRVGFKSVEWQSCAGAPAGADPWICVVNGKPIFLQGVNWTPIRPNFADVTTADVRARLETYRDLGCNIMRVWGGAVLEREDFYSLCDELGLLVWQEFPLSSSGMDNWPPADAGSIDALGRIATSYIQRRQHHASLLLWCGGNELQGDLDGNKTGTGKPVDASHPLIARLQSVVQAEDPGRRFLATSASGPRFTADAKDFGKGLHWDVHGPWSAEAEAYWAADDALFRSEVGAPGASNAELIEATAGGLPTLPASHENPLWQRTAWWIEWDACIAELGREPRDLEEYVAWSQTRQAAALARAVRTCKSRFPRCGGVILWMGHDCFPCTANTAILDFHGQLKPAARAIGEVFRSGPER